MTVCPETADGYADGTAVASGVQQKHRCFLAHEQKPPMADELLVEAEPLARAETTPEVPTSLVEEPLWSDSALQPEAVTAEVATAAAQQPLFAADYNSCSGTETAEAPQDALQFTEAAGAAVEVAGFPSAPETETPLLVAAVEEAAADPVVPPLTLSLTRPPPELPPQLLAEYQADDRDGLLGEGAFAIVQRLRHRSTGGLVALKVVEKEPLHLRNMLPQLQRELKIQSSLRHRNILELLQCIEDDAYVYMLLEHCAGGTLKTLASAAPSHRLPEQPAAWYFTQILKGVEWMHMSSCVHRDLKLENMLVTANDEIRICDFGWSAEVQLERALLTTCGTPHHWAPEIFEGAEQDFAVDIWTLGTLVYELLVGHPPFWGNSEELRQKILAVDLRYPPDLLSDEAISLFHCCLQRDPRHRMPCSRILVEHPWVRQPLLTLASLFGPSTPMTAALQQESVPLPLQMTQPQLFPPPTLSLPSLEAANSAAEILAAAAAAFPTPPAYTMDFTPMSVSTPVNATPQGQDAFGFEPSLFCLPPMELPNLSLDMPTQLSSDLFSPASLGIAVPFAAHEPQFPEISKDFFDPATFFTMPSVSMFSVEAMQFDGMTPLAHPLPQPSVQPLVQPPSFFVDDLGTSQFPASPPPAAANLGAPPINPFSPMALGSNADQGFSLPPLSGAPLQNLFQAGMTADNRKRMRFPS